MAADKIERMIARSEELQAYMTGIRRSLRCFPENGWLEMRTSALIARECMQMGEAEGQRSDEALCLGIADLIRAPEGEQHREFENRGSGDISVMMNRVKNAAAMDVLA